MRKRSIYLLANYVTRPRDPKKTHIPGYMKDPANHQYDEQVSIVTGLRPKDHNCKVILNLSEKKIERNGFNSGKSFDELFKYFFTGYHKYVTEVMAKLDPEYFNQMLDEMQAEIDASKNEEVPAQ